MKRWGLLLVLVVVLVAAGITVHWWLTPLLAYIGAKTELIQGLEAAIQIVLWLVAGVAGLIAWFRRANKPAAAPASPSAMPAETRSGAFNNNDRNPARWDWRHLLVVMPLGIGNLKSRKLLLFLKHFLSSSARRLKA